MKPLLYFYFIKAFLFIFIELISFSQMLKKLTSLLIPLILSLIIWFLYYSTMPRDSTEAEVSTTQWSTERAFQHVEEISKQPHYVGSLGHSLVRNYIVKTLQDQGLEVQTQEGFSLTKNGILTKPQNILARIPGLENGKSLLLMSHYDSAGHSSFGASDAGSGVATVLEGIRVILAEGIQPKNDIIILFTDAEELGLNGAEIFVNDHPWAKNVGVALNFEARGSGGNSFMLLETNGGNKKLIEDFIDANPRFPVTNSLAYSIYKMLPNDTDLTVLREQGGINGFNFAFIDDHFDYHTANDIPANLDKETLAQQGSYLMPLLHYFKEADLSSFESEEDLIYFNIPTGEIVSYPFSWIFPMLILAFMLFLAVVVYGITKKRFSIGSVLTGAVPFLVALIGSGLVIFFLWKLCLILYPQYREMINGFTYNGYYYIYGSIFLSLSICLLSYKKLSRRDNGASILVFPLFFWLLICAVAAIHLKGAAYFIIPAYFAVLQLWVLIRQKSPNLFLMLLLSLPSLVILLPFITSFPVALGLKILFVAGILTVLLFSLFLPVFGAFKGKRPLAFLLFITFLIFFLIAHFKSDYSEERPRPDSLVYLFDADSNKASWNSYDLELDDWNRNYFKEDAKSNVPISVNFESKYGSGFHHTSNAPLVKTPVPAISYTQIKRKDSSDVLKSYSFKIAPNRKINRMELYLDKEYNFEEFEVNGLTADWYLAKDNNYNVFKSRWSNRLLTYHAANGDSLIINFTTKNKVAPEIVLFESSYDLLKNEALKVKPRDNKKMPKPFVLNDAVIVKKTIRLEE